MVTLQTYDSCNNVILKEEPVEILSAKVIELRKKIYDKEYLSNAINRMAQVISRGLVETPEELKVSN